MSRTRSSQSLPVQPMSHDLIPDQFPVLRRTDLTLRQLEEADLPAWFARLTDPEAATMAGDPIAESLEFVLEAMDYHARAFRQKEGVRWSIVPAKLGSVGTIGFDSFCVDSGLSAEIGGAISRAHWNRGFITAAAKLVVKFAFETLRLDYIQADVLATNSASIRSLEKLGFQRQRVIENYRTIEDRVCDGFAYRLEARGGG